MNIIRKIQHKISVERRKKRWEKYSHEQIFSEIYHQRLWQNQESDSGPGSTLESTVEICQFLPELIQKLNIISILDLACGDFNWLKEIDLSKVKYEGYDIVAPLIEKNIEKYKSANVNFKKVDIVNTELPKSDLIICRDLMVHFTEKDNIRLLKNIKNSKSKYILLTTFPKEENKNIIAGTWRPVNLQKSPYHFPKPDMTVIENKSNEHLPFPQKQLALWDIKRLINDEKAD